MYKKKKILPSPKNMNNFLKTKFSHLKFFFFYFSYCVVKYYLAIL